MTYRLTRAAATDLRRIYIEGAAVFGSLQAERYYARFEHTFELLALNPGMARERSELSPRPAFIPAARTSSFISPIPTWAYLSYACAMPARTGCTNTVPDEFPLLAVYLTARRHSSRTQPRRTREGIVNLRPQDRGAPCLWPRQATPTFVTSAQSL